MSPRLSQLATRDDSAPPDAPPARGAAMPRQTALIVRLRNWVGEVVLAVPALQRLQQAGYELHLCGKRWAADLLRGCGWPVAVYPRGLLPAARALRQLRAQLRATGRPVEALLMTTSFSSAAEMRLAGLRPDGYASDARSLLLRRHWPLPRTAHAAQSYWQLVGHFLGDVAPFPGPIGWRPHPAQMLAARELLAAHALQEREFALLCPLSGPDDAAERKVWPAFPQLARRLRERGIPIVICPGPGEYERAAARFPGAVLMGNVDLGVYGALQSLARVVIANDTGPGHLAAAAGARLIAIYGPHSSAAWAPLGARTELFHGADRWVDLDTVTAAALA
ncbi:MAG: hypothetical protein NZM12_06290 [Steroidobacteraceae bacterium]|nr:hypothetical protein [Steroidobacteraceae bacterium]MDW8260554.1 glycosyltransferase family 9 protein [Gammaproteobacteria bacterium]